MNLAFRQSALIASGQIASGVALGRQIDAGLDAIDHLPSLVLACFYRGINAAQVGDHGGAQGFFDRVIHIADTGHFPHWHALAELHSARLLGLAGRLEESLAGMEAAQVKLRSLGVKIAETGYILARTRVLQLMGRGAEALASMEGAADILPVLYPEFLRQKGELLQETAPARAMACYRESAELSRQHGTNITGLFAACALASLQGEGSGSAEALDLVSEFYQRLPPEPELPIFEKVRKLLVPA
jgi:hypothetical protein